MMEQFPSYLSLFESGELYQRIEQLMEILEACTLCPRQCRVNRKKGEIGVCGAGYKLTVSSAFPHFGEEPPLVGRYGSGTIFLTYCNLKCVFCQNYEISHQGEGMEWSEEKLANQMLMLQNQGSHNINFVTPTHFIPQLVAALPLAIQRGFRLPLVYNSGGYEQLAVIKLLEGIIDIYMPDAKFADPEVARKYCNAPDYPEVNQKVLKEMHRQVGVLQINKSGIAERGLLIRHLVMPNNLAGTEKIMKFIAEELSLDSYVNIMAQYYPCFKANQYPELSRRITPKEFQQAIQIARSYGLYRGFGE